MPVRSGERLDPEATRGRILTVAEEVFSRHGINAVGVADIAEAAGASKASIYKNFASKDGLVEATLRFRSDRVRRWLEDGSNDLPPGRERVLRLFDLMAGWYTESDFHGCALVSAAAEDRVRDAAPRALARAHLEIYRTLFRESLEALGVDDPDGLARRLVVLLEGATIVSAIDGDPGVGADARALAEQLLSAAGQDTMVDQRDLPPAVGQGPAARLS